MPFIRQCSSGHPNPRGDRADYCLTCGEGPLSEAVPYLHLKLRWLLRPLLLLFGVYVWRWACHHPLCALATLWRAGLWTASVIFDAPQSLLLSVIKQGITLYIFAWCLSYLLPAQAGKAVRQSLQALLRQGKGVARGLWKMIAKWVAAKRGDS